MSDDVRPVGSAHPEKRTKAVKVHLTDSEFVDACTMANAEDRALSDFIARLLRISLYGTLRADQRPGQWANSDFAGRSGSERGEP